MSTALVVAVLALAPNPSPATSVDVAVASTCDYLIMSVHNPTNTPVAIQARVGRNREPVQRVQPFDTMPINLPARDGLRASLVVDGARLGPWIYQAPEVCPSMGGAVNQDNVISGPTAQVPADEPGHSVGYYLLLGVLALLITGVTAVASHARSTGQLGREPKREGGRHRKPGQPALAQEVSFAVKRRAVRRWMLTRQRTEEG